MGLPCTRMEHPRRWPGGVQSRSVGWAPALPSSGRVTDAEHAEQRRRVAVVVLNAIEAERRRIEALFREQHGASGFSGWNVGPSSSPI